MDDHSAESRTQRLQMVGLVLWRGGLAFVLAWGFYHGAWQIIRQLAWPPQVLYGTAIGLAGLALVLLSLIMERIEAARREGDSLHD